MKNVTKIIAMILAFAVSAIVFASCSGGETETTAAAPETTEAAPETTAEITVEETADEGGIISGGWEICEDAAANISADEQAVFDKAVAGIGEGVEYTAKDVIATQVVAGKNYAFLCTGKVVVPDAQPKWYVITASADLEGSVTAASTTEIDVANIKTVDNLPEAGLSGGWSPDVNETALAISEKVDGAVGSNVGVALTPIALLGKQIVAGTNYRILAYGSVASAETVEGLYVVDVYEPLDGNTEITSVSVFDLDFYLPGK